MSEDSLSVLSSELVQQTLKSFLMSKLKSDDIEISVESQPEFNEFYSGLRFHCVNAKNNKQSDENELQEFDVVVRMASQHFIVRQTFIVRPLFLREIFIFDEVNSIAFIFLL